MRDDPQAETVPDRCVVTFTDKKGKGERLHENTDHRR